LEKQRLRRERLRRIAQNINRRVSGKSVPGDSLILPRANRSRAASADYIASAGRGGEPAAASRELMMARANKRNLISGFWPGCIHGQRRRQWPGGRRPVPAHSLGRCVAAPRLRLNRMPGCAHGKGCRSASVSGMSPWSERVHRTMLNSESRGRPRRSRVCCAESWA